MVTARVALGVLGLAACADVLGVEETVPEELDLDHDGVANEDDNCELPNPSQADHDGDGIGDVCQRPPRYDFGDPADWTKADRLDEIAAFEPATGMWMLRSRGVETVKFIMFGGATDRPTAADFSGDGQADLVVVAGTTWRWRSASNHASGEILFPEGHGTLVPADYDGDGTADAATFQGATGTWTVKRSSDGVVDRHAVGRSGDVPLVGDFDGDRRDDFMVFRATAGASEWVRWSSAGLAMSARGAGLPGDIPVVADYDGDGDDDLLTWRWPALDAPYAAWFLDGQSLGEFGLPGDCPLALRDRPAEASQPPVTLVAFRRPGIATPGTSERLNRWFLRGGSTPTLGGADAVLIPIGARESCVP